MASGHDYSTIKRVVSIIITDYEIILENRKYHQQFRYRSEDNTEFTNLTEINTLELCKIPINTDRTALWYWMKFIKSDDKEVLDMLTQSSPHMRKAVGVLKELSADECNRMLYEEREKARRDIASMMSRARAEGLAKGCTDIARKLLKRNRPIEEIDVFELFKLLKNILLHA